VFWWSRRQSDCGNKRLYTRPFSTGLRQGYGERTAVAQRPMGVQWQAKDTSGCRLTFVGRSVGATDGTTVEMTVGFAVGTRVGLVVGPTVGHRDGTVVGTRVGRLEGIPVGTLLGLLVGVVGSWVGRVVGVVVGDDVWYPTLGEG
jgi:hypothetical protein